MNNRFSDFVRKSTIIVILRILAFLIIPSTVVIFGYITKRYLIIVGFLVIVCIVFAFMNNNNRKRALKYGLGNVVDSSIYIPLMFDKEYLKVISSELNYNTEIPSNINNLVSYVQYMIDNNKMIFVERKFKLDDIINLLNTLMQSNNINFTLSKDDIMAYDDEIVKLRRKDNIINDLHDLSIIRSILEKNQLEIISFFSPYGELSQTVRLQGYILAVVPINRVETLKKHQIDMAQKHNYR